MHIRIAKLCPMVCSISFIYVALSVDSDLRCNQTVGRAHFEAADCFNGIFNNLAQHIFRKAWVLEGPPLTDLLTSSVAT